MLFLKMCEDKNLIPIVSLLLKLTDTNNKNTTLDIIDFRLTSDWTDVITKIL